MSKEVARKMDLAGPAISGTVTVTLLELDQMRADHANAVKIAEELRSREKQVTVTLVEKKEVYDYARHQNGRFVIDTKYIEIGCEWKNIEDFREIIHQEEHDKVHGDMIRMVGTIQKLEDTIVDKEKAYQKLYSDLIEVKKANGELISTGNGFKQEAERLQKELDNCANHAKDLKTDHDNQVSISEGINERLKLALIEVDYWKSKKSIWFRWFGL